MQAVSSPSASSRTTSVPGGQPDHPGRALAATVPFLLALFAAVVLHLVLPHDGAYATDAPAHAVSNDTNAPESVPGGHPEVKAVRP